jgi:hypothetical protein
VKVIERAPEDIKEKARLLFFTAFLHRLGA